MSEIFVQLLQGFTVALDPINIFAVVIGGLMGVVVGGLPGLGSVAGVALLLPLTFKMNPTTAVIMLAGIYYGNMFGGSISAILLNIPGDSPAVMTAIDGYQLSRQGKAGKALYAAFFASFIGGMIGAVILTFLGPALAFVGLRFGPAEFTSLILFALMSVGWLLGDNPVKGIMATGIGLLLSTIGVDMIQGLPRFTFGMVNLTAGVPFIPTVIGIFGFAQVLKLLVGHGKSQTTALTARISIRDSLLSVKEWAEISFTIVRNGIIGFFVGLLPGSGSTMASFMAYIAEMRLNKHPERMGKGALAGVAAPEAANNAASIGAFAPLLSLGIPGSGTTALLLGGLMMWGLTPGPLLFKEAPEFVWSLMASIYLGDAVVLILCVLLVPFLTYIPRVPTAILAPTTIALCVLGSFSVSNSIFDVWFMLFMGVVGYFMNRLDFPTPPLALALVLAPRLQTAFRQALMISGGSPMIFITKPISLAFLVAAVVMMIFPMLVKKKKDNLPA